MAKGAKKGGAAALQTEVTTDAEWQEILDRKGLVLVDVYSEWSGPCAAIISTLRKIKMEIGGDVLSYALARNDDIAFLERFRGKSEPVWMFLQNGQMVNLVFGAHCPNLQLIIAGELRRVQQDEPPKWRLSVDKRGPEEESRWQQKETIRKAKEEQKMAKEEAEKRAKYEEFMDQEMFELCEETAIIFYPWVFLDDEGYPRDKGNCPAYAELVQDILPGHFDISEQSRIQLDEGMIKRLFVESEMEITEDSIIGLTQDKCMAIRLKARPPAPEWPVPFPNECPEDTTPRCPIRAINDAENYLRSILEAPPQPERTSIEGSYLERHVYVHEPDSENEENRQRIYPAIWIPPHTGTKIFRAFVKTTLLNQSNRKTDFGVLNSAHDQELPPNQQARSKVHVFKTVFGGYMEKSHFYEEPVVPPPLCAYKFDATKFAAIQIAYESFMSAVKKFGVFEFDDPPRARRLASTPDDWENKVKYKIGNEIFVIVLRRTDDETFIAFAGSEPYFVTEDNDEAERIAEEYFPDGAVDVLRDDPEEEHDFYEAYEEEEEEEEEEEDDDDYVDAEEDGVPPSFVDLSMF